MVPVVILAVLLLSMAMQWRGDCGDFDRLSFSYRDSSYGDSSTAVSVSGITTRESKVAGKMLLLLGTSLARGAHPPAAGHGTRHLLRILAKDEAVLGV